MLRHFEIGFFSLLLPRFHRRRRPLFFPRLSRFFFFSPSPNPLHSWLGAEERHLDKYAAWWRSKGWETRLIAFDASTTMSFASAERAFDQHLADLAARLDSCEWTGQAIHDAVYEAKGDRKPGEAFRALYQAILGQDRGPRAGFFLSSLERDWVLARLAEVG